MTAAKLKEMFRESATGFIFSGRCVSVSASHPDDDDPEGGGVLIQSEMSAEDQRLTGKRFHCIGLSARELECFKIAATRAAEVSGKFRAKSAEVRKAKAEARKRAEENQ